MIITILTRKNTFPFFSNTLVPGRLNSLDCPRGRCCVRRRRLAIGGLGRTSSATSAFDAAQCGETRWPRGRQQWCGPAASRTCILLSTPHASHRPGALLSRHNPCTLPLIRRTLCRVGGSTSTPSPAPSRRRSSSRATPPSSFSIFHAHRDCMDLVAGESWYYCDPLDNRSSSLLCCARHVV